jgi:hypothetical protein
VNSLRNLERTSPILKYALAGTAIMQPPQTKLGDTYRFESHLQL